MMTEVLLLSFALLDTAGLLVLTVYFVSFIFTVLIDVFARISDISYPRSAKRLSI